MTPQASLLRHCDIDAYRAWSSRRVGPSYLRGIPTWVVQTALHTKRQRVGDRVAR